MWSREKRWDWTSEITCVLEIKDSVSLGRGGGVGAVTIESDIGFRVCLKLLVGPENLNVAEARKWGHRTEG